jgi:hypothetical protein
LLLPFDGEKALAGAGVERRTSKLACGDDDEARRCLAIVAVRAVAGAGRLSVR